MRSGKKINDNESNYSNAGSEIKKEQFSNRFQGKQDFVTKDGHYGIVKNTKNPIQKGGMSEMAKASQKPQQDEQFELFNSDYESPSKKNSNDYVTANFPTQNNKKNEFAVSPKK